MSKLTARVVQGAVQFVFYATASALILSFPGLVGLLIGGELSA